MNRVLFKQMMDSNNIRKYSDYERRKIINERVEKTQRHNYPRGLIMSDIVREELSELDIEISKATRGELNKIGMLEEMADVAISLLLLQDIYGISEDDLQKAIDIKLSMIVNKPIKFNENNLYLGVSNKND